MNERNLRRSNVIIFNVIEARNVDLKTSLQHDTDTVNNLIHYIDPKLSTALKTSYRLGKFVKNIPKPRPMRIVFSTQDQAHSFISRFLEMTKKPQEYPQIMTISVSRD